MADNRIKLKRICPICRHDYGKLLHEIRFSMEHIPIPTEYGVVCCENCGFAFADSDALQEDYNNYYANFNVYSAFGTLRNNVANSLNNIYYSVFHKYVDTSKKIIDVGCGSGDWLYHLKNNGYKDLYGMDPSQNSILKLEEYNIKGVIGNLFDPVMEEQKGSYDVLSLTVVLEHIYDIQGAMDNLLLYLKPDGMFFVSVPAVEGFELCGANISDCFNQEHINYFSLGALDNLMHQKGLRRINSDQEALLEEQMTIVALYAFDENVSTKIVRCEATERLISGYFAHMTDAENRKISHLRRIMDENDDGIIAWGIGAFYGRMSELIPELSLKIKYYVDNNPNKTGNRCKGKEIITAAMVPPEDRKLPVVIFSMNNLEDIRRQAEELGYTKIDTFV